MPSDWGLLYFDQNQLSLQPYQSFAGGVNCHHFKGEELWLGTNNGLYTLTKAGKKQRFNILSTAQEAPKVYHIYEDQAANFWLATDQGLIYWKPQANTYQQFTTQDGLSHDHLHAVYPDQQGYLWLSSNYGLMRFDPRNYEVRTYFAEDGLPNNELNRLSHFRDEAGQLYFGGLTGISVFDPAQINAQSTARLAPLSVTEVTLFDQDDNQPFDVTATAHTAQVVDFLPSVNRLRIHFTVPYFGKHPMQYVWRIGADNDWNELQEPTLEIGRLPYGTHEVELGAFLVGNKQESMVTQDLRVNVLKPFYLQNWFLLVSGLSFFALMGIISYFSRRQLRMRNLELEQRVQARTQELATQNEVISQQAAALLQLDEAKSRFFINLSHELRTPLSLVAGPVAELQKGTNLTPAQQKHLLRIANNTSKIELLVEELMTLARLDAGQLPVETEPVQWSTFTRRIFNSFSTRATELALRYDFHFQGDENAWVLLDASKVERILNNLLSNALKFTPSNGKIELWSELGNELRLTVANSGSYIPDAEQVLIFERYYQAPLQAYDHRTGFGIGLALAKEYAGLLQGALNVQSSPAAGTRFTLSLPAVVTRTGIVSLPEEHAATVPNKLSTVQTPPNTSSSPRLLLVEDDPDMLDYLVDILQAHYQLTLASDGQQALVILAEKFEEIDLVISDAMMPRLDGFALLKEIRTAYQQHLVPFILLTALAEPGARVRALRTGVDAYLTKPFSKAELLARIENLLQYRDQRRQFLSEPIADTTTMDKNDLSSYDEQWMEKFDNIIKENLHQAGLKINNIADHMHLSERTLRTQVKANTGMSPAQYLQKARLDRAMVYLESKHFKTIAEVCYAVGIRNSSHFSRAFKKEFGKSPSEYL